MSAHVHTPWLISGELYVNMQLMLQSRNSPRCNRSDRIYSLISNANRIWAGFPVDRLSHKMCQEYCECGNFPFGRSFHGTLLSTNIKVQRLHTHCLEFLLFCRLLLRSHSHKAIEHSNTLDLHDLATGSSNSRVLYVFCQSLISCISFKVVV